MAGLVKDTLVYRKTDQDLCIERQSWIYVKEHLDVYKPLYKVYGYVIKCNIKVNSISFYIYPHNTTHTILGNILVVALFSKQLLQKQKPKRLANFG